MKKTIIILGSVVSAVVVLSAIGLFAVGTALAQTPAPWTGIPMMAWNHAGSCGGDYGGGCVISGTDTLRDAVAETLGVTTEQIYAERAAGKTLAQIAADKGVSEQQLTDAIVAALKQVTDQAVQDGRITQAQADWVQTLSKTMVPLMLNAPLGPGGMQGFGGRGHGRGWGGMFGHAAPWGA